MINLDITARAIRSVPRSVSAAFARRYAPSIPATDAAAAHRQGLHFIARLAAALIVPFVLLCAVIGHAWVQTEQERMTGLLAGQAAAAASDVEQFLSSHTALLRALATSPALDQGDFTRFEAQAHELLDHDVVGLVLRDALGVVRLDTISPSGTRGEGAGFAGDALMRAGGEAYVSDLVEDAFGVRHSVITAVPVLRDGTVRYTLYAVIRPEALVNVLQEGGLGPEQFASVADRGGRAIASTDGHALAVGQVVAGFSQRVGMSGLWSGPSLRGVPVRINYQRIPASGWLVSISMTQEAFRAPFVRSLWGLAGLTVALVVGATLLVLPLVLQRLAVQRTVLDAHRRLWETSELLRLAQDAAGAGYWEWEPSLDRISLAPASARMHGLLMPHAPADIPIVVSLKQWKACVVPDDLPQVWARVKAMSPASPTNSVEFRTSDPLTGARRWVQSLCRVFFDPDTGEVLRYVGLHIDVTVRREAEEALRASEARLRVSEERLALALDSGEDGLIDTDIERRSNWVSVRWVEHLGYPPEVADFPASFWRQAVHPDDAARLTAEFDAHLEGRTPAIENEHRLRRADGAYVWVLLRARASSRNPGGRPKRLVGTLMDITARKRVEARVEYMALHDDLTGLPNRRLFRQRLDRAIATARDGGQTAAVLACDLDGFKAINDTLGHGGGDRLLGAVADRLRGSVRAHDTVARLGGDEFAVVLERLDGPHEVERAAERIRAAVEAPVEIDGVLVEVGIGVGAVMVSRDGPNADDLFKQADMALYEAKAASRNGYRLFEPGRGACRSHRSQLALEMREAIRRGDFRLVYQPVVEVATDLVVSFEALLRWRHPLRGEIAPSDFIPVAEDTGLITQLGAWALREACREAMNWPAALRVGVNVSAVQFRGDLENEVLSALAGTGLPAHRLKLEVTESVLMQDAETVLACLHRLRGLGVLIALDDFGTGYSSLSYLRRFPFDKIKIDRSFIRDIADPDAAAIVRAVVGIGERLGMGIVAEGVETAEQLELVRREGCAQVQGFYFSRPLPPEDIQTYIGLSLRAA